MSLTMDLASLRETLLAPGFDAEQYASAMIQSGGGGEQQRRDLQSAEAEVDAQLQEQVSGHYEDLISQATGVERLEAHLEMMSAHMDALSAASDRLRARVVEPYRKIRAQTVALERLQETCDMLR